MDFDQTSLDAVAERLKWLRGYMSLSQKEMAASLGVTASRYNNWERARQRLPLDGALMIKQLYGVPLDFMLCGEADKLSAQLFKAWIDHARVASSK